MPGLTRYDYFYDAQVKRYLMQVVRAFSGFQYRSGQRGERDGALHIVPCLPAKRNRQAAAILRNASENTLLSVPQITVDLVNFEPDRERMQNPNHVDSVHATERAIDPVTGEYSNTRGTSVTIDRLMPRPYVMTVQVDIWTSTMDQKHQLMEQIDTVIFPGFDIQNSDNPLDWSALTTVQFESQQWTSLSIPIGTGGENEIDIATITLKIPMWLTPPAMLHRQTLVEQINTNINEAEKDDDGVIIATNNLFTHVTTPGNHWIRVEKGYITLCGDNAQIKDHIGREYSWEQLFADYSAIIRPSETKIILRSTLSEDTSNDIVGTIQPTEDANIVLWQPDISTLPRNTIPGVDAIIDPMFSVPGDDNLPAPANGQRYLITNDLAGGSLAWGSVTARVGSVIQYSAGIWTVAFDASVHHDTVEYVVNRMTGRQLKWDIESQGWVMSLDGHYSPGYWRLGIV